MEELAFKTRIVPQQAVCLCGSEFIRSVCYNCGNVREDNNTYLLIPISIRESKPPKKSKGWSAVQKKRHRIFDRDGWMCLKCGIRTGDKRGRKTILLTIDHVIPKSKGGSNLDDNLQTLCKKCNGEKGDTHVDYRKPK